MKPPTLIKRFSNRRLYNTAAAQFISVDDLPNLIAQNPVTILDYTTGQDVTTLVLIRQLKYANFNDCPPNIIAELLVLDRSRSPALAAFILNQAASLLRKLRSDNPSPFPNDYDQDAWLQQLFESPPQPTPAKPETPSNSTPFPTKPLDLLPLQAAVANLLSAASLKEPTED